MKINFLHSRRDAGANSGALRSTAITKVWLLLTILLGVLGANLMQAAQQVEIYSLSLRFQSSTATQAGLIWRLDLTSGSQNTPPNGELPLADGVNNFTHSGFIFLFNPVLSRTDYYAVSINIPTDDQDGNGIFDVLEQEEVALIHTTGTYTDGNDNVHPLQLTWNKAAGTNKGTCALDFTDLALRFEAVFENIHYSGTYDYLKTGSALTGSIATYRNGEAESALTGDLNLSIASPSLLTWGSGQWQTDTGATITYEGSDLDRSAPFEYSAFYVDFDGDLTTPLPDYQTWLLVLPNIPDVNSNGTPDLIENLVPEVGPTLALVKQGDTLILTVTGGRGRTFDLETKSALAGEETWTKVATITFVADSEPVPVNFSMEENAFWRLKQ